MRQALREQNYNVISLMLLLGLTPIFRSGFMHESLYYFFWLATITGIIQLLKRWNHDLIFPVIYLPLALFFLWSSASILWTVSSYQTLSQLWKLGLYGLVFALSVTLKPNECLKLLRLVSIVGTAVALLGITQYMLVGAGMITSTFFNSNALGIYLGMVVLITLLPVLVAKKVKWGQFITVSIAVGGLVLTGSRGAIIAFSAALLVGLITLKAYRWPQIRRLGLVVLISTLLLTVVVKAAPDPAETANVKNIGKKFQLIIDNLTGQPLNITEEGEKLFVNSVRRPLTPTDSSVLDRWSYWRVAGRMIRDYVWLGIGLDGYQAAYFAFWDGDDEYSRYAHNQYLQTGAELGLPGMFLFTLFLGIFMFNRWRARKGVDPETSAVYIASWCAGLAFILHMVVDFNWHIPAVAKTFWALLGVTVVLGRRDQNYLSTWKLNRRFRWAPLVAILILLLVSGLQYGSFLMAQKGSVAEIDGNLPEARKYYFQATRLNPYRSLYYQFLARIEARLAGTSEKKADLAGALAAAERAVAVDPYDREANDLLGRLQWRAGEVEEAEASLRLAVKYGGFYPVHYAALGNYYLSRKRYPEAEQVFLRGLELKDYALAKADVAKESERITASVVDLHLGLARALDEQKNYQAASQELYKVLEIDPDNTVALRVLASYRARKLG